MPLKVIAFPNPSNPALRGVKIRELNDVTNNLPADWEWVSYTSPQSLQRALQRTISRAHTCLEALEIYAHGSQGLCNALTLRNLAVWARLLNQLDWCNDSSIYLSGCNTGCHHLVGSGISIAQSLSGLMPGSQPRNAIIFGARGYISGSQARDDAKVTKTCTLPASASNLQKLTPPPDSEDASGPFSWRAFQNGVQLP